MLSAGSDLGDRKITFPDESSNRFSPVLIGYLGLFAFEADQSCPEGLFSGSYKICGNGPVLLYLEAGDLGFTLADQAECDGLYPSG